MCGRERKYINVHIYIYIYMCVCVCVCVRERERERERKREREIYFIRFLQSLTILKITSNLVHALKKRTDVAYLVEFSFSDRCVIKSSANIAHTLQNTPIHSHTYTYTHIHIHTHTNTYICIYIFVYKLHIGTQCNSSLLWKWNWCAEFKSWRPISERKNFEFKPLGAR